MNSPRSSVSTPPPSLPVSTALFPSSTGPPPTCSLLKHCAATRPSSRTGALGAAYSVRMSGWATNMVCIVILLLSSTALGLTVGYDGVANDLEYHYQLGFGSELSPYLGMPWVSAVTRLLDGSAASNASSNGTSSAASQNVWISFSHREGEYIIFFQRAYSFTKLI